MMQNTSRPQGWSNNDKSVRMMRSITAPKYEFRVTDSSYIWGDLNHKSDPLKAEDTQMLHLQVTHSKSKHMLLSAKRYDLSYL